MKSSAAQRSAVRARDALPWCLLVTVKLGGFLHPRAWNHVEGLPGHGNQAFQEPG